MKRAELLLVRMDAVASKGQLKVNTSTARRLWIRMFDPKSTQGTRKEFMGLIRHDLEREYAPSRNYDVRIDNPGMLQERLSRIEQGSFVGIVMVSGYPCGRDVISLAREAGIMTRPILIGYSHQNAHGKKRFSDGAVMDNETVFIPQEHLAMLTQDPMADMLLAETGIDTGKTLLTVERALRERGYEGRLLLTTYRPYGSIAFSDPVPLEEALRDKQDVEIAARLRIRTEAGYA